MSIHEALDGIIKRLRDWPAPIAIADPETPDCPLVFVNSSFSKLTGYEIDEIVGRNCRFLQGESTDQAAVGDLRKSIEAAQSIEICLLNYTKDGRAFHNYLFMEHLKTPDNHAWIIASQFEFDLPLVNKQAPLASDLRSDLAHLMIAQKQIAAQNQQYFNVNMEMRHEAVVMLMHSYVSLQQGKAM